MRNQGDLDLNLIVVFDDLLRHRSVTRAALAGGVTQGTISKALKKLRLYYDDPLFLKTNDGVTPTPKALAMEPDVTGMVRAARNSLIGRGAFEPSTAQRTINLSVSDGTELVFIPALMAHLRSLAPNCSLRTIDALGREREALETGEIDIAIYGPIKTTGRIRQQKLFDHVMVVLAHRDCPFNEEITIEQMATLEHVAIAPTRSDRLSIEAQIAKAGVQRSPALTTPHWLIVPHVVAGNPSTVSIVPRKLAEIYRDLFGLKVLTPRFDLPLIEVLQFWHERSDFDPFNVWLRTLLKQMFFKNADLHVR